MELSHKASKLENLFHGLSDLIEEGHMKLEEDGLTIVATDPAMVVMADVEIEPEWFNIYEPIDVDEDDDDADQMIAVNFETLYTVLKNFDDGTSVTIEPKSDIHEEPELHIESADGDDVTLNLLRLEDERPDVDDLEFDREGDIDIGDLKDALDRAGIWSDSFTLTFQDEEITVEAEGDMGGGSHPIDVENPDDGDDVTTMLASDYLTNVRKALNRFDKSKATIRMGEDFPCELEVEGISFSFTYIIAPRIEED